MAEEEVSRLLEETVPEEESGPLSLYVPLLVLLSFLVLFLDILRRLLPPSLGSVAAWLVAGVAGVVLASLGLVALTTAGIKSRWGGLIATVLVLLGWLGWILLVPKPAPAGLLGAAVAFLVPLLLAAVAFLAGLYAVSGFLLPIAEQGKHRDQVFKLLLDYLLRQNYPCYVVAREAREDDKIIERVKGNLFNPLTFGPGVIISDCDHAVAVSDGITFKGTQGPGVIFTTFGDLPVRTLDLRPQLRTFTSRALTRDGIEVEALSFVPFQIDRGGLKPQLGEPFPYRRSAAFKAVQAQNMEHPGTGDETEQRDWDELPEIIGARVLQDVLSSHGFDGLYRPYDIEGVPPRIPIAKEFADRLAKELRLLGIQLVGGGISNLLPADDRVLEQRVRSWQAGWARQVMLKQARSQAERLGRIERARAEAQADLILALGEMLAGLDRPGAGVTPERIVSEFLRVLEELALRPSLRRYIPREVREDVRRLRAPFGEPEQQ